LTTGNTIQEQGRAIPHRCPICAKTPADYTGKLVFPGEEAPVCENHKKALRQGRLTVAQVTMVPVSA
jgi:hypothetical protein